MATVADIPLTLDRVAIDHRIGSKSAALERLSALLASGVPELSARAVLDGLVERETLGSTCLGKGAALPHTRLGSAGRVAGALLSLPKGVDFEAMDGAPVHLVFGLLVPEAATAQHLGILSLLASAFRKPEFGVNLCAAESAQTLYERFIDGVSDSS